MAGETKTRDPKEAILAAVCRRGQLTCQQGGKSREHVERYLVLHLVPRTREARWPGDYELQCTRCLTSGRHRSVRWWWNVRCSLRGLNIHNCPGLRVQGFFVPRR
jgi:hypothetical protein